MNDSTTRFSDKANVYALARPRYPLTLVHHLEQAGVLKPGMILADVGSGTGLSAEPFLQTGYQVIGIEPNDAMRQEGNRYLAGHSGFQSVAGTATATTLTAKSIDFAFAAQAFHWFDLESTRTEMQRILKPPGWFLAVWNHRNPSSSPFQAAYEALLLQYCPEYPELARLYRSPERSAAFFSAGYCDVTLRHPQQLPWPLFEARLLSASYLPEQNSPAFQRLLEEMHKLFDTYAIGGILHFELELWLHYGKLLPK